jgi:hypothetical protein
MVHFSTETKAGCQDDAIVTCKAGVLVIPLSGLHFLHNYNGEKLLLNRYFNFEHGNRK